VNSTQQPKVQFIYLFLFFVIITCLIFCQRNWSFSSSATLWT
jgi:hypothetical protein